MAWVKILGSTLWFWHTLFSMEHNLVRVRQWDPTKSVDRGTNLSTWHSSSLLKWNNWTNHVLPSWMPKKMILCSSCSQPASPIVVAHESRAGTDQPMLVAWECPVPERCIIEHLTSLHCSCIPLVFPKGNLALSVFHVLQVWLPFFFLDKFLRRLAKSRHRYKAGSKAGAGNCSAPWLVRCGSDEGTW